MRVWEENNQGCNLEAHSSFGIICGGLYGSMGLHSLFHETLDVELVEKSKSLEEFSEVNSDDSILIAKAVSGGTDFDVNQSAVSLVLLLLFVSSLLVGHHGFEEATALSEQEVKDLEKQLLLINKPAVTTIHTDHGDIIDCVDFYKQPAFDHPLLKNHTFHYQMKPISVHRGTRDQVSPNFTRTPVRLGLKGGGCPVGTVPIRRITKGDLMRDRLASKITSLEVNNPGTHDAVVRTRANSNQKFIGAGAQISVEAPHVDGGQYSAAKMKIQNGPDSIEVGWRVDPSLYGDTRSRLFIRLDAGQSHCFNTRCPGFIIVRSDLPLDYAFDEDQANGNWWLEVGRNNTEIGFWPSRLFTGLGDLANHLEWGGEAYGPPGTLTPPMGREFFPRGSPSYDASIRQILVLNEYGQTVDIDNLEEYSDNNNLYQVKDRGNVGVNCGSGRTRALLEAIRVIYVPARKDAHPNSLCVVLETYATSYVAKTNPCINGDAVVRTRANSNEKFIGAGAHISVEAPHVDGGQYSAAKMKIQNGPDSIEVRWRVDPSLYGDTRSRLFIHVDVGQSHCFNTRCLGFIIVRLDLPLDYAFDEVSYRGGPFFYLYAYIIRDQANGNWWLEVGPNNTEIGFWPNRLFTGLGDLANHLEWGGEAYGPPGTLTPPMGREFFPRGSAIYDATIMQILVLNEYGQTVDIDDLEEYSDNNNLYKVKDRGNIPDDGHYMVYGGPGGRNTQV
ncbi:hypothetical protein Vadar_011957 [Vaccinium darrowii]|uniref:Uncharacterized protein n=1 Tax=Vaccinium darrowii TaxID=229202 RepID=A0ACB7XQ07_9ERIC|nr:hypothetical protein Vadar_011957 [Vaccinium darrowii]